MPLLMYVLHKWKRGGGIVFFIITIYIYVNLQMNINAYVGIIILNNFFSEKNIKIFVGIKFSRLAHLEYFLKPFFCQNPPKIKVYRVFNLSISLMKLIVPIFLSFSGYYVKGTNWRERNFSLNLFLRNIL